jgi:hypothetical protein
MLANAKGYSLKSAYLTTSRERAEWYADPSGAATALGGVAAVFEVHVPNDELHRFGQTTSISGGVILSIGDVIPPEWIKGIAIKRSKGGWSEMKALAGVTVLYVGIRFAPKFAVLGGPGSGTFGHAGRPGQVGGSSRRGDFHVVPADAFQQYSADGHYPLYHFTQAAGFESRYVGGIGRVKDYDPSATVQKLDPNGSSSWTRDPHYAVYGERSDVRLTVADKQTLGVVTEPFVAAVGTGNVHDDEFTAGTFEHEEIVPGVVSMDKVTEIAVTNEVYEDWKRLPALYRGYAAQDKAPEAYRRDADFYERLLKDPRLKVGLTIRSEFDKARNRHRGFKDLGGPGSGNFGHGGRPGQVGGSASSNTYGSTHAPGTTRESRLFARNMNVLRDAAKGYDFPFEQIDVIDDERSFTVGEHVFNEAAHYKPGHEKIVFRRSTLEQKPPHVIEAMFAHEVMHRDWDNVQEAIQLNDDGELEGHPDTLHAVMDVQEGATPVRRWPGACSSAGPITFRHSGSAPTSRRLSPRPCATWTCSSRRLRPSRPRRLPISIMRSDCLVRSASWACGT